MALNAKILADTGEGAAFPVFDAFEFGVGDVALRDGRLDIGVKFERRLLEAFDQRGPVADDVVRCGRQGSPSFGDCEKLKRMYTKILWGATGDFFLETASSLRVIALADEVEPPQIIFCPTILTFDYRLECFRNEGVAAPVRGHRNLPPVWMPELLMRPSLTDEKEAVALERGNQFSGRE